MIIGSVKQLGQYKIKISSALRKSDNIKEILLGVGYDEELAEVDLEKYIIDHLYDDDIITETKTYILFDVDMDNMRPNTKDCNVIMKFICNKSILDDYQKDGYYGNRTDILTQMVEEIITDEEVVDEFGIGDIQFRKVGIYETKTMYGRIARLFVPDFR